MIDQQSAELIADLVFVRLSNSHKIAYSIESAAKACDLSQSTIRDAIDAGTLPASKPARKYVITRDALETWLRRTRRG